MQLDHNFSQEDREKINPCNSSSIADALDFVKNPVKCCKHVHELIKSLMEIVQAKKEDAKTKGIFFCNKRIFYKVNSTFTKQCVVSPIVFLVFSRGYHITTFVVTLVAIFCVLMTKKSFRSEESDGLKLKQKHRVSLFCSTQ